MKRSLTVVLATLMIATGCSIQNSSQTSTPDTRPLTGITPGVEGVFAAGGVMHPFASCSSFLAHVKRLAMERVGPYGLNGGYDVYPVTVDFAEMRAEDSAGSSSTAPAYSTTNVQVAGIDEPDLVKTDGERIFVVANGRLYWINVSADVPTIATSIALDGWGQQLFLSGDTLLVMTSSGGYWGPMVETDVIGPYGYGNQRTVLQEVDVSTPQRMKVVRTLTLDGTTVSSRMTDGVARIVVQSNPVGFDWAYPEGNGIRAEREATEKNKKIISESTLENWVPWYVLDDQLRGTTSEGPLLDCSQIAYPDEFSGLSMLSVLSLDVESALAPTGGIGLLAVGQTVYASHDNLYVATSPWQWWDVDDAANDSRSVGTQIHQFDITDPRSARYVASGEVDGALHSQWALDEYQGVLRVVVTDESPWWRGSGVPETSVVTLEARGDTLVKIGSVGGLGKNEQVYSVRFIRDKGYVVTFRQVDPLYVIDLSDPRRPTVEGELKINGYSAYLHPIGENLILGVGQDATDEGRTTGTQLSVFDVSDPANPVRLSRLTFKDAYSDAEWDHHAFLWWPETDTAVLPLQRWSFDEAKGYDDSFSGAVVVHANAQAITSVGEIEHPSHKDQFCDDCRSWSEPIIRSIVIGDTLFTVSNTGIMATDMESLEMVEWLRF